MQASLFLIPVTLGDTDHRRVLPEYNREIILQIKYFIVENIRTARRFLKKTEPSIVIDDLTFYELNKHTSPEDVAGYLVPLTKGEHVGVISEAGCPAVADPGADVVAIAQRKNYPVVPLVGPSSILMSVMASGFNGQSFAFHGYLPIDASERTNTIKKLEGRIYSENQTQLFIETPYRNNILVISDEIHAEMAYPQFTHHPFATVSEAAVNCSITFMAPSKTFNIAGIVTSYSIVPNEKIRKEFYEFLEAGELGDGTIFAYTATEAAYTYGAEWLQQMRMYVMENVRFVDEFFKTKLPKIKVYPPQASFLVWLDCRDLKLSQEELVHLFQDKAGLLLNDGSMFGPGGEGYMRLNVGCPRSVLDTALNALKKAIDKK